MTTRSPNLDRLLEEWQLLHRRYARTRIPPELERLQLALRRRTTKIEHIRSQIAELKVELKTLETETEGVDRTMELVLSEAIAEIREEHKDAWSPTPILGFRVWDVGPSGFHGYQQKWSASTLDAECLQTKSNPGEVPHTDDSCGHPPCGIYAVKNVALLIKSAHGHPSKRLAVGLVGMSGKVVEHESGYRAAKVQVLALGVPQKDEPFLTADQWQIESFFTNTSTLNLLLDLGDEPSLKSERQNEQIIRFLREEERTRSWTLASPNE